MSTLALFDKLQKLAVKWILREQHESYSELVILQKQKELDILPMEQKVLFSDLILFFKIVNNQVEIQLPEYITRIEPHDVKHVTRCSMQMFDGRHNLKYRCKAQPQDKCFQDSFLSEL